MIRSYRTPSRLSLALSLVAASVLGLIALLSLEVDPAATQQSNFMGGNPTSLDPGGVRTNRLRFQAGSRTNWHIHPDGQLLMIESGRGRTQDRGRPVRETLPGQPWWTPGSVQHWHGAAPAQEAIQWTTMNRDSTANTTKWFEPVSDTDYRAPLVK